MQFTTAILDTRMGRTYMNRSAIPSSMDSGKGCNSRIPKNGYTKHCSGHKCAKKYRSDRKSDVVQGIKKLNNQHTLIYFLTVLMDIFN